MRYRAIESFFTALMVIAFASIALPTVAVAKPALKPDLVIRDFRFSSPPTAGPAFSGQLVIIETNGIGHFSISFTVKNVGHALAHTSRAQLVIGGKKFMTFKIGQLAAGKSKTVSNDFQPPFSGPGIFPFFVCADFSGAIDESKESNNCTKTASFVAVPRQWDVHQFQTGFHSTDSGNGVYDSNGMIFDFYGTLTADGQESFIWQANGSVIATLSGVDTAACVHSGTGTATHSPWDKGRSYLQMSTDLEGYFARLEDSTSTFTGSATCPPPNPGYNTEESYLPMNTLDSSGGGDFYLPTTATAKSLSGDYYFPGGEGEDVYGLWRFDAHVK